MKISTMVARIFRRSPDEREDQIARSKKLINSIQKLVGIDDVFGDKKRSFSISSVWGVVLFCSFLYLGAFSQSMYLLRVFPDKVEIFKVINCLSATGVPFTKYVFMWTSRDRLKHVFEVCRQGMVALPKGSSASTAFHRTLNKASYIAWLVMANQFISHFLYLLAPIVLTLTSGTRHLPMTPGQAFGMTNKYETPFYELTFVVTTFAIVFSVINQTGYIILFVTILAHELGHCHAISETLLDLQKKLSDGEISTTTKEAIVKETLRFCIKQHQFLQRYHATVKEFYRAIFGVHFVIMIVVLVTTLQTLNSWDIRNTVITGVTGIFPLIIYCFGGEMLITAEREISWCLYNCGWEMMSPSQARVVLLMLCISQKPLYLTAADIFVMNRETFGDVVQVVYKVYTVLN